MNKSIHKIVSVKNPVPGSPQMYEQTVFKRIGEELL